MNADRTYVEENARQLERLRALVVRVTEDELRRHASAEWTVAAALLHVAYWDVRALWLAGKIERRESFTSAEAEPEPPDWLNDTMRPFLHAVPPRDAARLALSIAEECDRTIASLPAEKLWPNDRSSLLNAFRSEHRREHLDQIEDALRR